MPTTDTDSSGHGAECFFYVFCCGGDGVPVEVALGALFWAGVIFFVLSVFNIRTKIVEAIPKQIRYAIAGGIGLFIALLGFVNAGFIIAKPPLIGLGQMNIVTLIFIGGILLISVLIVKNIRGAMMIGIIAITLFCIPVGRWLGDASSVNQGIPTLINWKGFYQAPDFSFFFKLDLVNSLKLALWPVIFAVLFTDMFDSLSTFVGVAEAAGLKDEKGEPRNIKQSLIVDAVQPGWPVRWGQHQNSLHRVGFRRCPGRTHRAYCRGGGLLFIPFMFFSPLLSMIPSVATAPVLVIVGVFMMKPIMNIRWDKMDDAIPCFLAMILIPLTYSITQGIIWGLLSWTLIKLITGKFKEVSITLYIIDIFSILLLIFE